MNAETEELEARAKASEAYHEHPSNPSSCRVYAEHNGYGSRCPCEDGWRLHTGRPRGFTAALGGGDCPSPFESEWTEDNECLKADAQPPGITYSLEEILRSTSISSPLLSDAMCARRKEWEGNGGYPEGEGMTISPGGYLVWSEDGESMMGLRPEDVLATDWFLFERSKA